jgi:hypothetical protein
MDEAWSRGYDDFFNCNFLNPYSPDTREWHEWMDGNLAASDATYEDEPDRYFLR